MGSQRERIADHRSGVGSDLFANRAGKRVFYYERKSCEKGVKAGCNCLDTKES